jgi:hypothetical protein
VLQRGEGLFRSRERGEVAQKCGHCNEVCDVVLMEGLDEGGYVMGHWVWEDYGGAACRTSGEFCSRL